jgi:hypothetical protein
MRHGLRTTAVAVGACAVLSGCFGSSSPEPTAAHAHHHKSHGSTPSTSTTTAPTISPSTSGAPVPRVLRFDQPSNSEHSRECFNVSADGPTDYVYFPVLVRSSTVVDLDTAGTAHSAGVRDVASWIATAPDPADHGVIPGWPADPAVSKSKALNWSQRVPAAGAALQPDTAWYSVFVHVVVDTTQLPAHIGGLVLSYHDATGAGAVKWVDHITFAAAC